jgi:hypothetical protein
MNATYPAHHHNNEEYNIIQEHKLGKGEDSICKLNSTCRLSKEILTKNPKRHLMFTQMNTKC